MRLLLLSYKIFENLQQAKAILKSEEIPEDYPTFLEIKKLLSNHVGYIGWFTKMLFVNKVPMSELTWLFNIITNESEIIN